MIYEEGMRQKEKESLRKSLDSLPLWMAAECSENTLVNVLEWEMNVTPPLHEYNRISRDKRGCDVNISTAQVPRLFLTINYTLNTAQLRNGAGME